MSDNITTEEDHPEINECSSENDHSKKSCNFGFAMSNSIEEVQKENSRTASVASQRIKKETKGDMLLNIVTPTLVDLNNIIVKDDTKKIDNPKKQE